jgi:hypothetical protein
MKKIKNDPKNYLTRAMIANPQLRKEKQTIIHQTNEGELAKEEPLSIDRFMTLTIFCYCGQIHQLKIAYSIEAQLHMEKEWHIDFHQTLADEMRFLLDHEFDNVHPLKLTEWRELPIVIEIIEPEEIDRNEIIHKIENWLKDG